jgi:hypothetical protein
VNNIVIVPAGSPSTPRLSIRPRPPTRNKTTNRRPRELVCCLHRNPFASVRPASSAAGMCPPGGEQASRSVLRISNSTSSFPFTSLRVGAYGGCGDSGQPLHALPAIRYEFMRRSTASGKYPRMEHPHFGPMGTYSAPPGRTASATSPSRGTGDADGCGIHRPPRIPAGEDAGASQIRSRCVAIGVFGAREVAVTIGIICLSKSIYWVALFP